MSWKRRIGWAALATVILLIVFVTAGYFYLKSTSFRRFALSKIVEQANQATGGKTTIGGMDFSLSGLTATLYDITLLDREGTGRPPLLHADKLTVGITVVSALRRQVSLSELLIVRPVIHIQVSPNGKINLPTPPQTQTSNHISVFDLAISHAQITNGELDYNDQTIPLEADLCDLGTEIRFTPESKMYSGVISYKNGRLKYAAYKPVAHDLDLRFSATPAKLTVEGATLRVASSNLVLQGRVSDYSNPVADGTYQVLLHTQDFREMSKAMKPEGNVLLAGKLHYEATTNQPALRSVSVDGHLASEVLAAVVPGKRVEVRNVAGDYRLANGNLTVSNLKVDSFGGKITANGEMKHLDAGPDSRVRASLQGISLKALQEYFGARRTKSALISGSLDGTAEATWKGDLKSLKAQTDLTCRAQASSAATPASSVPLSGALHLAYDAARQSIDVRDTSIKIPSATLNAKGTISDHSNLQLQLAANDLHELEELVTSLMAMPNPPPPISGKATVNAVVQGSLKKPAVNAQLTATDLEVQRSHWRSATLAVRANPSEVRLENGRLTNARQGEASFNAAVQLNQWTYQPTGRIQAHLDAEQFRLADLLQVADQQYPMSGVVTAKLSMDGSQLDPAASGQIEVANAAAYGEPVQKATLDIRTQNGSIVSKLAVASKAGHIDGDISYAPKTGAYQVRVDAPAIVLEHLRTVQERHLELTGTVAASIHGEGSVDDPQLTAIVQLPQLHARGRSISELKAEARVAQHRLNLNVDSKVSQVGVHAQGQVELSGDYETQASVDTGTIALESLLATYSSKIPAGFQGQTELHATLHGPLKDKTRLQAHLSVPVLKATYQTLEVGIKSPIQADYAKSVVTLHPADFEGTGTSLHIEGHVPIGGTSAPTLSAKGTVNLKILKALSPDLNSSGQLAIDVNTAGTSAVPDVRGQVELKNFALTTPDMPVGIEKLNGIFDVSSDRLTVSKLTGTMGGGQVSIAGTITYRPSLQFDLALQSNSVRLPYPEGLRTMLSANLKFNGNTNASIVNGRVVVDSLSFTPDFDLSTFADQFSTGGTISQPGFADTITLAIVVQTAQTLNATSSTISIAGQAALRVGGTAANPVITGRTTLSSGELFYRTVRYRLQRGVITFDDPNETHPVLNVSVATTIEQYNLTLTMRGPLEKLTTSYISDPPLATADIINLVARGKTTQESAAGTQSTDSMIASQAASRLSSSVQKLAGLSSLQIDPTIGGSGQNPSARIALQQRVTKNLLFTFSTDVSKPGSEVIQGEYQINRRWSVSAGRDESGGVSVDARYHKRF